MVSRKCSFRRYQSRLSAERRRICHAAAQQAGFCEHKTIEKEDNYFELTRRLEIDETISFKAEKIEHPHFTEEVTAVVDTGYLFFTDQQHHLFKQ